MKMKIVMNLWIAAFVVMGILQQDQVFAVAGGMDFKDMKLKKIENASSRLSSELIRMSEKARTGSSKGRSASGMEPMMPWIRQVNGLPELEICLDTTEAGAVQEARDWLINLGMTVTSVSSRYGMIYGTVPPELFDDLEQIPHLVQARPNYLPRLNVGSVESEGDAAMETQTLRDTYGIDGAGVVVGVISDSFDAAGADVDASIVNGDLPGPGNPNGYTTAVTVLADADSGTDEGRAMAEIIHDVAPGATLVFHAAFLGGRAGLAEAFTSLHEYGVDIIVDDVNYLTQPCYQDGIIAQAAQEAADDGILLFSSAGNLADRAMEMQYQDIDPILNDTLLGMGHDLHDFGQGTPYTEVTVAPGHYFTASLWWSEPYDGTLGPGASQDLDFYVFDAESGKLVYGANTSQGCSLVQGVGGDPNELVAYQNTTDETKCVRLAVDRICGTGDDLSLKISIFGTSGIELDPALFNATTVYGHAAAPGVMAVGAVYAGDTDAFNDPPNDPVPVEPFTSKGDNIRMFFDDNGHDLPYAPVKRSKPEIAAPDGVSTSTAGFETFYGTSAAAPHAGAMAALFLESAPVGADPLIIADCMRAGAMDVAESGWDGYSGNGLINGPNAAAILLAEGAGVYAIEAGSGSHGAVHPSGRMIGYTPGIGDTLPAHDLTFTFTPETHYHVSDVLINGESAGVMSDYTFSGKTEDQTLYVEFSADTFTITAAAGDGGSISPSGAVPTVFADNQIFTMTADTGYTLTDVLVDGVSVGAVTSYAFTDTVSDHSIAAVFTLNTYTVTPAVEGVGALSPSDVQIVDHGSSLNLTATAGEGQHIAEILINGEAAGGEGQASYALFLSHIMEDTQVSAVFEADTFTVSLAGDHVSFDPSGSQDVAYGDSLTVTITPDDNYRITGIRVDGAVVDETESYTFENVTADHTLEVEVAKNGGGGGCFVSSVY